MIDPHRIDAAVDEIVAATLSGTDWMHGLRTLARAADARDAVLMRNSPHHMRSAVVTDEAAETVAAFARGVAPPNSRYARVRMGPGQGFRIDHDDYRPDELARDPFYQEFLRPAGVFWHANAILSVEAGDALELSFKRRRDSEPYSRADARRLDRMLPGLRAAARLQRRLLDSETTGVGRRLGLRSLALFELDRWGHVLRQSGEAAAPGLPLRVLRRRLVAADAADGRAVERAVFDATAADPVGLGLAVIGAPGTPDFILQVHPLGGIARDVFLSASAIAVLIARARPAGTYLTLAPALGRAFGLTDREAEVACLRAEGLEFEAIAGHLGISRATARTYAKFCYDKMGITRQAELVGLITRLLE
jgi:DNA-binding CsgD family transcriptional regulator